jgi:hypothetical protein
MPYVNHVNVQGSIYNKLRRHIAATVMAIQPLAGESESYMKTNAPWQNVTRNARNSLTGTVAVANSPQRTRISLKLSHGVDYGIWLELKNGGKFAIVRPTALIYRQKVRKACQRVWKNWTPGPTGPGGPVGLK